MSDHEMNDFAARIARPLQRAERLDETFDARVMSAVLADARSRGHGAAGAHRRVSWWQRRHTIELSPLSALAIAAGIATIAVLGAAGGTTLRDAIRPAAGAVASAAAPDTVHVVRFVFSDADARAVSLVGDFNDWAKGATPLVQEQGDGIWSASLVVPAGRHEYAFVVDRNGAEQWVADPAATRIQDDFGVESSVVMVGGAANRAGHLSTS
jgi:hypothetical protein